MPPRQVKGVGTAQRGCPFCAGAWSGECSTSVNIPLLTLARKKWSFEHSASPHVDPSSKTVYGSLDHIPAQMQDELRGYFDVIVCTQVFEHVRHPFASATAINNMLAPGGLIYLTIPFIERTHIGHVSEDHTKPVDHFRYTLQGVRELWAGKSDLTALAEYGAGHSLLTHAHLEGFGVDDFSAEELESLLFSVGGMAVGGNRHDDDLYFCVAMVLQKSVALTLDRAKGGEAIHH